MILEGQGIHTNQLNDFLQFRFFLEELHGLAPQFGEFLVHVIREPLGQPVNIKGVTGKPVDGREVSRIGQIRVQPPEHLDDTQRRLGNGFGNVSAGRRYGTDGGKGTFAAVGSETDHPSCSLVELGKPRSQIGGIALFTGHFLKPTGHLSQSFGPPGGGVCHQGYRVTHISIEFRNGNSRINGCFPGGYRHVGGVGDKHRPLHQRLAGLGVFQFRELHKYVCHLVAPLAASDVDYDVRIRPLGQLVLYYGLAAPERSRYSCNAAFRNGEQGIDNPLPS